MLIPELDFEERLGLEPTELLHDRVEERGAMPGAAHFDLDACCARLERVAGKGRRALDEWSWELGELRDPMSAEEALFWWTACTTPGTTRAFIEDYRREPASRTDLPPLREVVDTLGRFGDNFGDCTVPLLLITHLWSPEEILETLLEVREFPGEGWEQDRDERLHLVASLRAHLLSRLGPEQLASLMSAVVHRLAVSPWPGDVYRRPDLAWFVAAALGRSEVDACVAGWPDGRYGEEEWLEHFHQPQALVLMLDDVTRIVPEFARLELRLRHPWHVRALLARCGFDGLELLTSSVRACTERHQAERLLSALNRAVSPRLAPMMVDLLSHSEAVRWARRWIDAHPAMAVLGLAPILHQGGAAAQKAAELLRMLLRRHGPVFFDACLERLPRQDAMRLAKKVIEPIQREAPPLGSDEAPSWLVAPSGRVKKAPEWFALDELPALEIATEDGLRSLTPEFLQWVVSDLQRSTLENPGALVRELAGAQVNGSGERFAWALFKAWIAAGAPAKEKWAMFVLGHLGGDETALSLTPLVRAWPGESKHQRAVLGLAVLESIGTDTALMQINGIAQKVKFKALKARAQQAMETIAERRGLTRAELEDRIVPDCGLDEAGQRLFDYGPRQFGFALGADLKPKARDARGKLRANLPKAGVRDDGALAETALADWKLLKKQLRDVLKVQTVRLEQAMVTGRRWSPQDFNTLLLSHPLMGHLVPFLLWGRYDAAGELRECFVPEGWIARSFETGDKIGVVHPLELSEEQRYHHANLETLFPQLDREVHRLHPDEEQGRELTRFASIALSAGGMVRRLENVGWIRGQAEDAGIFCEHAKPFYAAGITAVVQYAGVPMGYMVDWEEQHIERCFFVPGVYHADPWYPDHEERISLGQVDAIVVSEVLRDLAAVTGG